MSPEKKRTLAAAWFRDLRDRICAALEAVEDAQTTGPLAERPAARFVRTVWDRPEGGGGEMSVMKGRVFEKVGVNISVVHGAFSEKFAREMPGASEDPRFWAAGISLVAHPHSALVPIVHMNTRMICVGAATQSQETFPALSAVHGTGQETGTGSNGKIWFGGGADLTPTFPDARDTADFHAALRAPCDAFDPDCHPRFKAWCDEYFFLPHRGEARGVGGIFYDYLESDWAREFDFTKAVGEAFLGIYPPIVARHQHKLWTPEQREALLLKRGRYAEFNLAFDRGTRFGLMTGGNTEAILMSLPPEVKWA